MLASRQSGCKTTAHKRDFDVGDGEEGALCKKRQQCHCVRERESGIVYQFSSTITRSSVSLYSLKNNVLSLQEDNIISIQIFSPVQRQLTILGNFKSQ